MKFSTELVEDTGTILAFFCTKDYKFPILLTTQLLSCTLLSFFTQYYSFFILVSLVLFLSYRKEVVKETLYVMKGLGLQITQISRDGSCTNLFIDNSEIREVIIKESMTPYNVRVNIAIIQVKASKLIIPFKDFEITLKEAKQIYSGTRSIFIN